MADSARNPAPRTMAALGVVVLAVVLAGVGLVLAIRQTQLLATQRIADARGEADRLSFDLQERVRQRVTEALVEVAEGCVRNQANGRPHDDPMGGVRRPTWLGDLFYCDEQSGVMEFWPGLPPVAGSQPRDPKRDDLLRNRVSGNLTAHLLLAEVVPPTTETVLLPDHIAEDPVLLAYLVTESFEPGPVIVAASLDLDRLWSSLLAPLVSSKSDRVQLVPADSPPGEWLHPLTPAMPFWAFEPTATFVQAQQAAVRRQTGVFVAITVMALVALLVVVWGLMQVVQRHVALSQLKSSFVADVSHELKTPLALIRLFGETLAEGRVTDPDKQKEYYEIIKRESTRLTHLINNILDFSRIDAGRKEYKMSPIDIGEVIRSTYDSYRFDLDHNNFEHRLTIEDNLPTIHADADAMSQAVLNLMSNALKYYEEERYLAVSVASETRRGRHGVLISVEDHGIGVRPDVRRHLFEGFYRVADDRVRKRRGAGLGLAVVKHIVDAHGGSVSVESRLVKGSTFRIFLPENQEGDARPMPRGERDQATGQ